MKLNFFYFKKWTITLPLYSVLVPRNLFRNFFFSQRGEKANGPSLYSIFVWFGAIIWTEKWSESKRLLPNDENNNKKNQQFSLCKTRMRLKLFVDANLFYHFQDSMAPDYWFVYVCVFFYCCCLLQFFFRWSFSTKVKTTTKKQQFSSQVQWNVILLFEKILNFFFK